MSSIISTSFNTSLTYQTWPKSEYQCHLNVINEFTLGVLLVSYQVFLAFENHWLAFQSQGDWFQLNASIAAYHVHHHFENQFDIFSVYLNSSRINDLFHVTCNWSINSFF